MTICYIHYTQRPCEQCALSAFARRAGVCHPSPSHGLTAPAVITFKSATFDNLYHPWETPREITTPAELLHETSSRGMYSEYLRDSLLWRDRPAREW